MPLLIRSLRNSTRSDFELPLADTVSQLAESVAQHAGLPSAMVRLVFRGSQLLDGSALLRDLGITARHFVVALLEEKGPTLGWIGSSDGRVPSGAISGGAEASGTVLYVARAHLSGGVHPGKAASELGREACRVGYGGGEVACATYEVLCARDKRGRPWPSYYALPRRGQQGGRQAHSALPLCAVRSAAALPDGALAAGWEADGTQLYAASAADPSSGLCPGKTRPGFDGCNVGFGGRELTLAPCFALCLPPGVGPPRESPRAPPPPPVRLRRHLDSCAELLSWHEGLVGIEPPPSPAAAAVAAAGAPPIRPLPKGRPRVLHCHDMQGGYCAGADEGYLECFAGWDAIDALIYFSHKRVALPPACWVEACHARGLPCLGTLITEGAAGALENALLLATPELAAEKLSELAARYGFDGWLVNIEADVGPAQVPALLELLQLLTICCRGRLGEQSLVIFYDSLTADGRVGYQNGLTEQNRQYFDACDGLFTNYWWREHTLRASAESARRAGERAHDVFVGVDVFARGDLTYTAGPGCATAVRLAREHGLSLALFAPGWSLECGEARGRTGEEARRCDARFWEALGVKRCFRPEHG